MIEIQSIADLKLVRESVDLECKLAAGRDGKGALPEDFWPTYSSFGNTEGGIVLLGVREKPEGFVVQGVANPAKVRKELFDALNNRQKVSVNLLTDAQVREVHLEGRLVIVVEVPRATRKQRPVHLATMLQNAVREGFLEAHNPGRGAVYCVPGAALPKPEEVFGDGSEHSVPSSAHLPGDTVSDDRRDALGRLLAAQLDAPVIDSLERLAPAFRQQLEKLAAEPRMRKKLPAEEMKGVVFAVCSGHYVTLGCLAQLVNPDSDAFRQQYLKPLAKDGKPRLAFPTTPTHAKQAYRSVD